MNALNSCDGICRFDSCTQLYTVNSVLKKVKKQRFVVVATQRSPLVQKRAYNEPQQWVKSAHLWGHSLVAEQKQMNHVLPIFTSFNLIITTYQRGFDSHCSHSQAFKICVLRAFCFKARKYSQEQK